MKVRVKMFKLLKQVLFLVLLSVCFGGCCNPLIYEPTFDSSFILSTHFLKYYDTLEKLPRDETPVFNGVNKYTGRKQPDEIKEMFNYGCDLGIYRFKLFYNEGAALKSYNFKLMSKYIPIYKEFENEEIKFYVNFTSRPRSDIEGGCKPFDYYCSSAVFLIKNIVVAVAVTHDNQKSDDLNKAVKYLINMLKDIE